MRPLKDYIKEEILHESGAESWTNRWYEDPESGCHFDNLGQLLQGQILGHCGCGHPEDNLLLVHEMLSINENFRKITENMHGNEFSIAWNEKEQKIKSYIIENWDKFAYFFWYVMNDKEIMEHGGSVPGWICDDNFLEAIKLWKKEHDESEGL